jgi:hypothetical protein
LLDHLFRCPTFAAPGILGTAKGNSPRLDYCLRIFDWFPTHPELTTLRRNTRRDFLASLSHVGAHRVNWVDWRFPFHVCCMLFHESSERPESSVNEGTVQYYWVSFIHQHKYFSIKFLEAVFQEQHKFPSRVSRLIQLIASSCFFNTRPVGGLHQPDLSGLLRPRQDSRT